MSKFYLWSIGNNGYVYSLSSWNSSWTRVDSMFNNVKQFRKVSAASWCTWAVGIDSEIYIYIPLSDAVIRSPEIVIESQRKLGGSFSSKHLTSLDPYEYITRNCNGKMVKTDLKSFKLPSNRWKWENDWEITTSAISALTNEGWVYSSNFARKFQSDRIFSHNQVRRRFWRRFRCFHAFDNWLQIEANQSYIQDSVAETSFSSITMRDIGCGGEMVPHQKDGYISVWVLSVEGQILYRLNVHRQNPEGSFWYPVKLPNHVKPISLAVGPLGSLFICCGLGQIYFRENITWKNLLGTSWKSLSAPHDLLEDEKIIQLSVSIYSLWARSSLDRLWSRSDVNLHETSTSLALGSSWSLVATDIQDMSSSCSEQLFVLSKGGKLAYYKTARSKSWSGKLYWNGQLPMEFGRLRENEDDIKEVGFDYLAAISSSGLFLEYDILPTNWVQSPLISRKRYQQKIDSECDWKIKISEALKTRDQLEFKNPQFSHYTPACEETFWSKASNCYVQVLSIDTYRKIWLSAKVVLHHKIKNSTRKATLHVDVKNRDLFKLHCIPAFIELNQIACVSKIQLGLSLSVLNGSMSGLAMNVFLKNEIPPTSSSSLSAGDTSSILFKFPSESDVEDWIMAINFAPLIQNSLSTAKCFNRVWLLNQYNEPFCNTFAEPNRQMDKWHQDGGHFRIIESGAKGAIVWAIGFNGVAWVHSDGCGGSYLSALCSSKYNLYQVSDSRSMYITEYQKLKLLPGCMTGQFQDYCWTDEAGSIVFDKEKLELPTKRWRWSTEWTVCPDENERNSCPDGWQYTNGVSPRYDEFNLTLHTNMRRRRWAREYTTNLVGPWKEIRNDVIKIIDISIYPDLESEESKSYRVLAVSSKNKLLLRKGVTLKQPEGLLWHQLQMELKIVSVSINSSGTVWVICVGGFAWRLKFTNFNDISKINRNDWELIKHPSADGRLTKVSSGSNRCVWVLDRDGRLWCRQFLDETGKTYESGFQWVSVCDDAVHVSCGVGMDSQISVWAVFTDGSVATRTGISPQLPQGTGWVVRLTGIGRYVAVNCA